MTNQCETYTLMDRGDDSALPVVAYQGVPRRLQLRGLRAGGTRPVRDALHELRGGHHLRSGTSGRTRRDSDRELHLRSGRRHSPAPAQFGPSHRRRALHAGSAPVARLPGGESFGHRGRAQSPGRARPVPRVPARARHRCGSGDGHRGGRGRHRPRRRHVEGRDCIRKRRRHLRARFGRRRHPGRRGQHDPLRDHGTGAERDRVHCATGQ